MRSNLKEHLTLSAKSSKNSRLDSSPPNVWPVHVQFIVYPFLPIFHLALTTFMAVHNHLQAAHHPKNIWTQKINFSPNSNGSRDLWFWSGSSEAIFLNFYLLRSMSHLKEWIPQNICMSMSISNEFCFSWKTFEQFKIFRWHFHVFALSTVTLTPHVKTTLWGWKES